MQDLDETGSGDHDVWVGIINPSHGNSGTGTIRIGCPRIEWGPYSHTPILPYPHTRMHLKPACSFWTSCNRHALHEVSSCMHSWRLHEGCMRKGARSRTQWVATECMDSFHAMLGRGHGLSQPRCACTWPSRIPPPSMPADTASHGIAVAADFAVLFSTITSAVLQIPVTANLQHCTLHVAGTAAVQYGIFAVRQARSTCSTCSTCNTCNTCSTCSTCSMQ